MPKLIALLLATFALGNDCPSGKLCLLIPQPLAPRAKLKAQLADDLVKSLRNDQDNLLDVKLEREIRDLEIQLLGERK